MELCVLSERGRRSGHAAFLHKLFSVSPNVGQRAGEGRRTFTATGGSCSRLNIRYFKAKNLLSHIEKPKDPIKYTWDIFIS